MNYCTNHIGFWLFGWVVFIFIAGIAPRFWWRRTQHYGQPLATAQSRYAAGELTKAEFEQIRKDIQMKEGRQ